MENTFDCVKVGGVCCPRRIDSKVHSLITTALPLMKAMFNLDSIVNVSTKYKMIWLRLTATATEQTMAIGHKGSPSSPRKIDDFSESRSTAMGELEPEKKQVVSSLIIAGCWKGCVQSTCYYGDFSDEENSERIKDLLVGQSP